MKGIFEEYGGFVATAIIGFLILSFLIASASSTDGAIHKFVVVGMENLGAETQIVIKEWNVDSINVAFKDDGGLYFTGHGTLPSYASIDDTPWAEMSGKISFVVIEDDVTTTGEILIK